MIKNTFHFVLIFTLLPLLIFPNCQKSSENEACEKLGETLLEPFASVALPDNTYSYPRISNGTVWYNSSSVLTGIEIESGDLKLVQKPPHFQLLNAHQFDQPYIGTDNTSLIRFNPEFNSWETLYSAADTEVIDSGLDLYSSYGLLPFVEKNNATKIQSIAVFDLNKKQKFDLPKIAALQSQHPFRVLTQPKVFIQNRLGSFPDTTFAILVNFSTKSTKSILIYSLTHQLVKAEIALDGLNYNDMLKIGDRLAVTTTGSFYSETLVMFNPFSGDELWRENAGGWVNFDRDLFKIIDGYLGGAQKINPENGTPIYTLPYDIDLYSACALQDNYCFLGRESSNEIEGLRNHLVIINNNGCEIFREKIPFQISLGYQSTASIYYPDSNYVLLLDEQKNLHFLRPE